MSKEKSTPKITVSFLWYDFWIGGFWDQKKRKLYICPLPCLVIAIQFKELEDSPFVGCTRKEGEFHLSDTRKFLSLTVKEQAARSDFYDKNPKWRKNFLNIHAKDALRIELKGMEK